MFDIGQFVRVRPDLEGGSYYGGTYFNEYMEYYRGKVFKIKSEKGYRIYSLDGAKEWAFNEEMLLPMDEIDGKIIFNPKDFLNDTVMYCPEKWMAENLFRVLNENGFKRCTGDGYVEADLWDEMYPCYKWSSGTRSVTERARSMGCVILDFNDFIWDYGVSDFEDTPEMERFMNMLIGR